MENSHRWCAWNPYVSEELKNKSYNMAGADTLSETTISKYNPNY